MAKILNQRQELALKLIGKSQLEKYFYWTGGTALFFYLHHRLSEDLDFMSEELLPDEFITKEISSISSEMRAKRVEHFKHFNRWQYFLFFPKAKQLKLEFVYYPFPKLDKCNQLKKYNIRIDSLKDIIVNKAHAIFERSEPKDIYDLYIIVRRKKMSLDQILKAVNKKFGVEIDPVIFMAKIMAGVKKNSQIKPLIIGEIPSAKFLKDYFQKIANQYLRKELRKL